MQLRLLACAVVASACLTAPPTGHAQVSAGLSELGFLGSFTRQTVGGESASGIAAQGAYGYFLTKNLELGGNLTLAAMTDSDTVGAFSGFLAVHFPSSSAPQTVPYIGAQLGSGFGFDDNPTTIGLFGGVKFFVTPGAAISLQPSYISQKTERATLNTFSIATGISLYL